MKFTYHIEGMHCAACIEKIKSSLSPHFKVIEVSLNPPQLQIEADKPPILSDLNAYISLAGKYHLQPDSNSNDQPPNDVDTNQAGLSAYSPIFLIAAYIIGVASLNNFHSQGINWQGWMSQFMAGFFLVFSAFKFLNIRGFAEGYSTYDLLAQRYYSYGYIYPFLELSLGILYLTQWLPTATQLATVIIMGFSSLGVINSLLKKQKFQCACLGTILKIPLSSITLIEDLTMVILAAAALIMS
ncbi:MAG: MauE/DoxX family redox-associated membrane protein [Gammaproteobacteria bacterium]